MKTKWRSHLTCKHLLITSLTVVNTMSLALTCDDSAICRWASDCRTLLAESTVAVVMSVSILSPSVDNSNAFAVDLRRSRLAHSRLASLSYNRK